MKKGLWFTVIAVVLTAAVILVPVLYSGTTQSKKPAPSGVQKAENNIIEHPSRDKSDSISDGVNESDESALFLVLLDEDSLLDTYLDGRYDDVPSLILSDEGKTRSDAIKKSQAVAKASIKKLIPKSDFEKSRSFSALLNGITVTAPRDSLEKIRQISNVSEVYELTDELFCMDRESSALEISSPDGDLRSENGTASASEESKKNKTDNGAAAISEVSAPSGNDRTTDTAIDTAADKTTGSTADKTADSPSGNAPETAAEANARLLSEAGSRMINSDTEAAGRYLGTGRLIAVIDSEFNTGDPVFSVSPSQPSKSRSDISSIGKRIRFNTAENVESESLYLSMKIAFAYDYAENDGNTRDDSLSHGTAVASAAAGNNGDGSGIPYRGTAPDAQLALMKVCSGRDSGGRIRINTDALLAAMDDAVKIGADVIDLSLGGYEYSRDQAVFQYAFGMLGNAGIAVTTAAGNEGYQSGSELPSAGDICYSVENRIASYDGVIAAGSIDNIMNVEHYILLDGEKLAYHMISDKPLTEAIVYTHGLAWSLGITSEKTQNNRYISFDAYFPDSTFSGVDIADATVILGAVKEEELLRACEEAEQKNAAAVILLRGSVPREGLGGIGIPVALLDQVPEHFLENKESDIYTIAGSGTYIIYTEPEVSQSKKGMTISDFTSYGAEDDLRIGSRIVLPGEDVSVVVSDGSRAYMTGTSASSAFAAGGYARIEQYLGEKLSDYSLGRRDIAGMTQALMLSSARPVTAGTQGAGGLYASPRLQGFGRLSIDGALNAGAFLTAGGRPEAVSLGDGKNNTFEFTFEINPIDSSAVTYKPSFVLQTDFMKNDGKGSVVNTLTPRSLTSGASAVFLADGKPVDSITAEPGVPVEVTVRLTVDERLLEGLLKDAPSGFYLDGYIFLTGDSGNVLNMPFTGLYGELSEIMPFDNTVYDNDPTLTGEESDLVSCAMKGEEIVSAPLVQLEDRLLFSKTSIRALTDDDGFGSAFVLPDLCFLRDVYDLTVTVYDSGENVLFSGRLGDYSSYRRSSHRSYEKLLGDSGELQSFFSQLQAGKYKYEVSASTKLFDGSLSEARSVSYWFELDDIKPALGETTLTQENGRLYLDLVASDSSGISDFVLYIALYDKKSGGYRYSDTIDDAIKAGTMSADAYSFVSRTGNEDGSETFRYEVTRLSSEIGRLAIRTEYQSEKCVDSKIVFRALDNAGNPSDSELADIVRYGSAEFVFTDADGRPARGISVTMQSQTLITDQDGKVVFTGLLPDYYNAVFEWDPAYYELPVGTCLAAVPADSLTFSREIAVTRLAEYADEADSPDTAVPDAAAQAAQLASEEQDRDEPALAYAFVSILLAVSAALFLIRKKPQ